MYQNPQRYREFLNTASSWHIKANFRRPFSLKPDLSAKIPAFSSLSPITLGLLPTMSGSFWKISILILDLHQFSTTHKTALCYKDAIIGISRMAHANNSIKRWRLLSQYITTGVLLPFYHIIEDFGWFNHFASKLTSKKTISFSSGLIRRRENAPDHKNHRCKTAS